ncbi:CDGSH iron-sulfur domain-containing protein [Streptomyces sp. NPDC002574]|uniref:CDGSH iron-sulfur domain-containing protein n=1 Tax=Streptomyces sp. NPDC002574 TaxID=3364652 RepID=UPI0036B1F40C
MANANGEPSPTRVTLTADGPILIEGPVEVVLDDGRVVRSDRFVVAVCACRRSRSYPWCDTSHRRRAGRPGADGTGAAAGRSGPS